MGNPTITVELCQLIYEQGTCVIGNDGQISFKIEKGN